MYIDKINPDHPEGRLLITDAGFELKDPTLPFSSVPLIQKTDALFKYLDEKNFETYYDTHMRKVLKIIQSSNAERDISTYSNLLTKHRDECRYLVLWLLYDFYDMMPTRKKISPSSYYELPSDYRNMVDDGMRVARKQGIRDLTISVEASMTTRFLHYLAKSGITNLSSLGENNVRDYVRNGKCTPMILYRISLFLRRYAQNTGNAEVKNVLHYFPKEKLERKIYPAFTHEEREKIEKYLLDAECPMTYRYKSIIALMLYLGMRSNDVHNLKLSSIEWEQNQIRFHQGKTNREIILPLRPVTGNFLYKYVTEERPSCKNDICFISNEMYGGEYCKCSIGGITNRFYDLIGIRQQGERRGTHLLRHSFADEMINRGSDVTMVSKVLGHLNPNTTLGYLSSNVEHLRACALDISFIPMSHKLYADE